MHVLRHTEVISDPDWTTGYRLGDLSSYASEERALPAPGDGRV